MANKLNKVSNDLDKRKEEEIYPIYFELLKTYLQPEQEERLANYGLAGHPELERKIQEEKDRVPILSLTRSYRFHNADYTLFIEEAYADLVDEPLIRNYYNRYNQNEGLVSEEDRYDANLIDVKYHIRVAYDKAGYGDIGLTDTFENGEVILKEAYEGKNKDKMVEILESKLSYKVGKKTIDCSEYLASKIQNIKDGKEKMMAVKK